MKKEKKWYIWFIAITREKELDKILAGTKTMVMRGENPSQPGLCGRAPLFHGKGERLHHGDWLIIEKIEDVVVGTSIPYNYEKSKF